MLVNKTTYDSGDIVAFKLVNGDEIVAKVGETNNDGYTVSSPLVVVPGQQGIGLIPFMFTLPADKKLQLNSEHIMCHAEAHENFRNHYIKMTTGIEPITRGSIIT